MSSLCGVVDFAEVDRARAGDIRLWADLRLDNRADLIRRLADLLPDGEPGDADLLLAAYLRWDEKCPAYLLGDFAFAIWDARQRRLFCARDPLGIKALHFARVDSLVCFATEAQQVLQHPSVPLRLDERTFADYLVDLWDDPARTFFLDVRRLPPGHRLLCTAAGDRLERYWDIDPDRQVTYRNDHEYGEHFLDLFQSAVAARLRSPAGPVGIALSGGLDSSAVAWAARRACPPGTGPELFACSFVFDRLAACDESRYITSTTAALSLDAEIIAAERFWPLGDAEAYRPRLENPFLSWESGFREMLSRVRARGARILLTGHGGDDLLAGSPLVYSDRLRQGDFGGLGETLRYALSHGRSAWRILYRYYGQPFLPAAVDRGLRRLLGRSQGIEALDWLHPDWARRTGLADRLHDFPPRSPRGAAWQELKDQVVRFCNWDRAVRWYDAQAAPFGLEVRHPFLDRRIPELLLAMPARQRSKPGVYKPLLRSVLDEPLPEEVRQRRDKTSLEAFIDLGLRREAAQIERLLAAPLTAEMGFLDGARLRAAFRAHLENGSTAASGLWRAVCAELWLREVFLQERTTRRAEPSAA